MRKRAIQRLSPTVGLLREPFVFSGLALSEGFAKSYVFPGLLMALPASPTVGREGNQLDSDLDGGDDVGFTKNRK